MRSTKHLGNGSAFMFSIVQIVTIELEKMSTLRIRRRLDLFH